MKRVLLSILVVSLCLGMVASASAACPDLVSTRNPVAFSSTIFMPTGYTVEETGFYRTRYDLNLCGNPCVITQPTPITISNPITCQGFKSFDLDICEPDPCEICDPCAPFMEKTIICCEKYKKLASASAKSGEWVKWGRKTLKEVLKQTNVDWIIVNYKNHTPSNNGWIELNLRNEKTGETLYCVMNLHTRGDGAKSDRVCTFTYGHLVNPSKRGQVAGVCWEVTPCFTRVRSAITTTGGLKLADYPAYYIIGEVGEDPMTAIAHFVYWLSQDINHAMPLEALAAE